jgi:hypothetical protein
MLESLGFESEIIDRVCFLVGHHHTVDGVDGPDWRILLEADFLVNAFEGEQPRAAIAAAYETLFETEAGRMFCRELYLT